MAQSASGRTARSKAPAGAPRNAGYTPNTDRLLYWLASDLSSSEYRALAHTRMVPA